MGCSPRMEQDPGCLENRPSKEQLTMEAAQAKGKGGGLGAVVSKRKEKPHATQEDSRASGGRRWWRKDLQETSTQTWHCQSS